MKIDGAYRPFNIRLGQTGALPSTAPFRLVPPQPAPPEVLAQTDQTPEEGQLAFLTAVLTDTDSPVGHEIAWQMGDGTTITGALAPAHLYADDGLYNVTLTITDVHGKVDNDSLAVTVTNVVPAVDFFRKPSRPEPGQLLTFTGQVDDPGLVDTHTYEWDFGDSAIATGSLTMTHSYAITGDYEVTLTAINDEGGIGAISYTVSVEPFGADFTGYPGVGLPPFTATFYDVSVGQVASRTWTFGDGSPAVTTNTTNIEHRYDTPGVYEVSLTIYGPSDADVVTRPGYIIAVSPETSGTIILEAEDYIRQIPGSGPTWEARTAQLNDIRLGHSGAGYVQANPDIDVLFETAATGVSSE